ncbi:MAG TPA: PIN domain-containing protein [Candidatus Thiothrix moscowensis]|mgnify:CR=1 FL=1|uniref:PIN domain-containing protein n=1 Tax=unclassified Thiothrix TaxID=2636184 RepID=UPI0025E9C5B7|nr:MULTISPECIES: PIN domain-containing protein [unclassified Thiothrix]HRJ54629.1 PIN domain-containing protein [Candidatus Thiothrix moscowensis]HRJ95032.1 PIN domain-containing protein [Candidatus Thiothrix moscowensis]
MSANCFADTNLLVYAFDSSEPAKQQIVLRILEEQGGNGQLTLSTQVLQEFFVTVTRKLAKPLSIEDAYACIQQFGVYPMVHITPELILRAISRTRDDAFSFWDSLIVEAALQAGCQTLFSEDMQDGRRIGQLVIQNPFKLKGDTA